MVRVSFSNMGSSNIPFKSFLESFPNIEVILPPPLTKKTIEIGNKYSPDYVCLPFRSCLGDFIRTLKTDEIDVFFTVMDCGPCRYGIFHAILEQILKDLGYDVKIISFGREDLLKFKWLRDLQEISREKNSLWRVLNLTQASQNFLRKAKILEDMDRLESYFRCREIKRGQTTIVYKSLLNELELLDKPEKISEFRKKMLTDFKTISIDLEKKPPKVSIVGEIHMIMEPSLNMGLKERLGENGIEVYQPQTILDWVLHKLHINYRKKELENLGNPYLKYNCGGESIWNIGEYLISQQKGYDGFVHVYPLMCMPEVVTRSIIESISHPKIPALFLSFDGLIDFKDINTKIQEFHEKMDRLWSKGMNISPKKKYLNEKSLLEVAEIKYSPILDDPFGAIGSIFNLIKDFNPLGMIKEIFPPPSKKHD